MKQIHIPGTAFIWLAAVLLYIGFFLWHNGLGTALSETEINHYLKQIQATRPDVEAEDMHAGVITGIPSRTTGVVVYRMLPLFPGIFEFALMRGETTEKDKKLARMFDKNVWGNGGPGSIQL